MTSPPNVHQATAATPTTAVHMKPPAPTTSQASPPSKRDLKSWWKNFKLSKHEEQHGEDPSTTTAASDTISTATATATTTTAAAAATTSILPRRVSSKRNTAFAGKWGTDRQHVSIDQILKIFDQRENAFALAPTLPLAESSGNSSSSNNKNNNIDNRGWLPRVSRRRNARRGFLTMYIEEKGLCVQNFDCIIRFAVLSRLTSADPKPQGIFGVPLRQSIVYANVAISLVDDHGKSYIYGYVPIVVAKCGVFLKEKGGCCVSLAANGRA